MNYTRLLAQNKLRETQRQRDRLRKQYDAIEARVARADTPLERLRALYQGLREVTFAQKPLHPGVRELEALYLADELGAVPPELVADRTRLLEREMAQGRLRAEFTYAFGRLLSEWTGPGTDAVDQAPPGPDPLALLWEEPPPCDLRWLEALFDRYRTAFRVIAELVGKFAQAEALAPVTNEEVSLLLARLGADGSARPALRRHARAV